MINVEWIDKGAALPEPYLYFGFDDLQEIMAGKVTAGFRKPSMSATHANTLAIYGDFDPQAATLAAEYTVFEKGDAADGSARLVYPLLNHPALPFRAGLTVHAARGTWSSLPHEFEREEILTPRPAPFYEKFCYITDPPGGWGVQTRIGHIFESDEYWPSQNFINDVRVFQDRDILEIPLGSHPVVASPGTRLAYIWIFWSGGPNRAVITGKRVKFTRTEAL